MKRLLLPLIFLFCVVVSCRDECKDVSCVNGECQEGECVCDEQYQGSDCSEERLPSLVYIDSIMIFGMDSYTQEEWDPPHEKEPDVYLSITESIRPQPWFESPELYENTTLGTFMFREGMPIVSEDVWNYYRFSLNDAEWSDIPPSEIYWFNMRLFVRGDGNPGFLEYRNEEGQGIKLWVRYEYN